MRCRKCGEKAVIHLHQHRLALCQAHFLQWLPEQIEHSIRRYKMFEKSDHVLVAVSGGKDSLALWDILHSLGYQTGGVYIDLGIDAGISYSSRSRKIVQDFASERNLPLHIINMEHDYQKTIPQLAEKSQRGQQKPCSVCGVVKRYLMNKAALEGGYSVLATGHNLDDEAAILLMNMLSWSSHLLGRQAPVLEAREGFIRKVKPICRNYERETAAYAMLKSIVVMQSECHYSTGSAQIYYKHILNRMEDDHPSTKLNFYLGYLRARQSGAFSALPNPQTIAADLTCPNCGQPTTSAGLCAFCKIMSGKPQTTY